MDSISIDESFVTGSGSLTRSLDERTLIFSPAPVAASTILTENRSGSSRVPLDLSESFFWDNRSAACEKDEQNESSLGLLPSNCLLDLENNLLVPGSICFPGDGFPAAGTPASSQPSIKSKSQLMDSKEHSSQSSILKSQYLDSASSKGHSSDSQEYMSTVKKCIQAGTSARVEGRYMPQTLFQSLQETNKSTLKDSLVSEHADLRKKVAESWHVNDPLQSFNSGGDSGLNSDGDFGNSQTISMGSQRSKFSEGISSAIDTQTSSSTMEKNGGDRQLVQAHDGQEEADHTIHQVELEAEDLQELEEAFSDFDASSDEEEKFDKLAHVNGGDIQQQKLSSNAYIKENCTNNPTKAASFSALPGIDGPFKVPLPPTSTHKMCCGNPVSTALSDKGRESSLTPGDSMQLHQAESMTEEWGPSIDFGSALYIEVDEDNPSNDHENSKEVPAANSRLFGYNQCTKKSDNSTGVNVSLGGFPDEMTSSGYGNPFTDLAPELSAGAFGDEDFMDTEAAAAMLAEDEQLYKMDNSVGTEQFNSTVEFSGRQEQKFMDMTIGTYMAVRSGELGSLTSYDKRPEFGMQVKSPLAVRCSGALLSADETFSPSNGDQPTCSPVSSFEDGTRADLVLEKTSTRADLVLEKTGTRADLVSEKTCTRADLVSEKTCTRADLVSEKTCTRADLVSEKTCTRADLVSEKTSTRADLVSEKTSPAEIPWSFNSEKPSDKQDLPRRDLPRREQANDHTLDQSQFASTDGNASLNGTSGEVTFNTIFKLLERPDFSFFDPAELLLSEYKRKMQKKEVSRQKTSQTLVEKKPDIDMSSAQAALQVQGQSSRKNTSIPHRTVQEISKASVAKPQVQTENNPTGHSILHQSVDTFKPEVYKPQVQTEKTSNVDPSTDLSKPGAKPQKQTESRATELSSSRDVSHISRTNVPQIRNDHSLTSESGLLPNQDITTSGLQSPKSPAGNTPTVENKCLATDNSCNPINDSSQRKPGQTAETRQVQTNSSLCGSETGKGKDEKSSTTDTSQGYRAVTQRDGHYSSSQPVSESSVYGNDSRPARKESASEHRLAALPLQPQHVPALPLQPPHVPALPLQPQHVPALPLQPPHMAPPAVFDDPTEDCDPSLECLTINTSNLTNTTVSHIENTTVPSLLKEKINQLSVIRKKLQPPQENWYRLLNMTADSSANHNNSDMSQCMSLLRESTDSFLQSTSIRDKFVSSTPLSSHPSGIQDFTSTQIMEETILPMITPRAVLNILEVPERVHIPEVCCVFLSQQTSFAITNLLSRGVKCQLKIREVTLRGQRIDNNLCPFELKRHVVLSPSCSENVQVIFRPKDPGEYIVYMEIFSWNMTNQQENRTYVLHLSACAEFPSLRICPASDEIDFGELMWGSTCCRSVKIQNIGHSTIPVRFSIVRKESTMCNFSFYPENQTDVSMISLTSRSAAAGSVCSLSLPGVKDGQKSATKIVNIYCRAKEPQDIHQKYLEKAERFQAVLSLGIDMPVDNTLYLNEIKLQVTVGMYKLHVDRDSLAISATPGKSGQGTFKIINSGNISMNVDILFESQREQFSLSTNNVLVPAAGNCPVQVTFTPQLTTQEQADNKVNVILQNAVTQHYICVLGQVNTTQTKIRGSFNEVNFGGVEQGQSQKQKYSFIADNDDDVRLWITLPGSAFKLLNEEGAVVEHLDMSVVKGMKYTVLIMFSPLEVKGYRTELMLQILYSDRYKIPIIGYGGCSKLVVENVTEAPSGGKWLDLGCLSPGTPIARRITVRNVGMRCGFIKTSIYDESRQQFQPVHASVTPSTLVLPPSEAAHLIMMINPSQKDVDLCSSGRAIVAIIKLTWGDEVARQQFRSNPGEESRQLVKSFDISLTSNQQEIVSNELRSISPSVNSYSLLKKAISVMRIGICADNQSVAPSLAPRLETSRSLAPPRPVLAPVNQNGAPIDRTKNDWTVAPLEIYLNADGPQVKDFVQIINFSPNELQFSVEHDKGITVVPNKAVVKPKNTTMLAVSADLVHFSWKEPAARCGLIKVHCSQQVKFVKVYVQVNPGRVLSPSGKRFDPSSTTTASPVLSPSSKRFDPSPSPTASAHSEPFKLLFARPSTEALADADTHRRAARPSTEVLADADSHRRVARPSTEALADADTYRRVARPSTEALADADTYRRVARPSTEALADADTYRRAARPSTEALADADSHRRAARPSTEALADADTYRRAARPSTEALADADTYRRAARPSPEALADADSHSSSLPDNRKAASMQGAEMIMLPTTEVGTETDQTYFFTNNGTGSIRWELAPFAPAYVKNADNTQTLYRINYDVFKLSPLTGVLQPDEMAKVLIKFYPQSKGSYNQAWCICDTSNGQGTFHKFSVYAKASSKPSLATGQQDLVLLGLSPSHISTTPEGTHSRLAAQMADSVQSETSESRRSQDGAVRGRHFIETARRNAQSNSAAQNLTNPRPSWSPVAPSNPQVSSNPEEAASHNGVREAASHNAVREAASHNTVREAASHNTVREAASHNAVREGADSSRSQQASAGADSQSLRGDRGTAHRPRGLHLLQDVIEFPKLCVGESTAVKIYLKNLSNEDAQVVLEYEPRPPFLIRHHQFPVRKGKMVIFPVTFKPRHVSEFKDKVVFRDLLTGNLLIAVLEAECVCVAGS